MDDYTGNGDVAMLRVVGVGGGGSNAVDRMIAENVGGVEFIALNTDAKALAKCGAPIRMCLSKTGLGCGGDWEKGRQYAEESADEVAALLRGADMVFITAGMGGGTGTGGAPVVAKLAKEAGALTVGVVTKPFVFEGKHRMDVALKGVDALRDSVDTLIAIPNQRLLSIADESVTLNDAFRLADDVLRQGIQGISDMIKRAGLVNVDFNDVRAIMSNGGSALMAIGRGQGEERAREAAAQAVNSSLLDMDINGARGVLYYITGPANLTLHEVNEAGGTIRDLVHPDANIIFGASVDDTLEDEISITLIATGFDEQVEEVAMPDTILPRREVAMGRSAKTIEFPWKEYGQRQGLGVPEFLSGSRTRAQ